MIIGSYDHLGQFLGSYFHQDWDAEFHTTEDVVAAFLRWEPTELRENVRNDIVRLLAEAHTEEELDGLFSDMGCYYAVDKHHSTYSLWLKQIFEIISFSH